MVETKYGYIEGFEKEGCEVYLGIPFAKPPVGELSFQHPLPPEAWTGTWKATQGSANPVQKDTGSYIVGNNSKDCLYLNVFVPKNTDGPLPVMVWIYGGAYTQGGAGALREGGPELEYDLTRFARDTGCIAVTFNYRLNVYGFLNLHSLDADFGQNNGLYDQIMALNFVKENIAGFGGDPGNVTVFGQSAGASCILALMGMKDAEGLFHKVIVQSPCVEHFFTEEESVKYAQSYLKHAGVKEPWDLVTLSEQQIRAANNAYERWVLMQRDIRCAFSPIIDGVTITEVPKEAVKKAQFPMLIGNVKEEGNMFINPFPAVVLPLAPFFMRIKPEAGDGSYRQRLSNALTKHVFIRPQLEILDAYAGTAWRYEYCYVYPNAPVGCGHCSELPVLFDKKMLGYEGDPVSEQVGNQMRSIWGRFAKEGATGWKPWQPEKDYFIIPHTDS